MGSWDWPGKGVVFWPVGNGDAITVVVDDDTFIQFDINHRDEADDKDDPRVPVVDRLAQLLPVSGAGHPKLSSLAISHHDEDHCSGFQKLLDQNFEIGELWLTLRSFVEEKDSPGGLTDVGQAVYDEACRRRKAEMDAHARGRRAPVGSRLRVIGNADVLDDPDWRAFPVDLLTSAGQLVPVVVGDDDKSEAVEVFVHTPFRSDNEDGSRNSSSLGVQLVLRGGACERRFLLLGDLEYQQIEAFVEKSVAKGNDDRLRWDVLLTPHHGSRNAVRRRDGDDWVDADAAKQLGSFAEEGAVVVVSARALEDVSGNDTDPPHVDAKKAYASMVGNDNVLLTSDYAAGSGSDPLTIEVGDGVCGQVNPPPGRGGESAKKLALGLGLAAAAVAGAVAAGRVRRGDKRTGPGDKPFA